MEKWNPALLSIATDQHSLRVPLSHKPGGYFKQNTMSLLLDNNLQPKPDTSFAKKTGHFHLLITGETFSQQHPVLPVSSLQDEVSKIVVG